MIRDYGRKLPALAHAHGRDTTALSCGSNPRLQVSGGGWIYTVTIGQQVLADVSRTFHMHALNSAEVKLRNTGTAYPAELQMEFAIRGFGTSLRSAPKTWIA
jgi:hypothetical protein